MYYDNWKYLSYTIAVVKIPGFRACRLFFLGLCTFKLQPVKSIEIHFVPLLLQYYFPYVHC